MKQSQKTSPNRRRRIAIIAGVIIVVVALIPILGIGSAGVVGAQLEKQ